MSIVVAAALFTLTLPYGGSMIRAEQASGSRATSQGQQGQGQQGQGQQGQGQQGQGQQAQGQLGQGQQGQQGAKPQPPDVSLRKFVITLALGDVQVGTGGTFTPAATKALADLRGFLPYKTYTLLDTVYKIGLSGPTAQMKGIEGQKYELMTNALANSRPGKTSLRLALRTVATPDQQVTFLIDTQFEIEIGETVVVGTSRLDGNRALLLLVTSAW
jgi:hypothetical protein